MTPTPTRPLILALALAASGSYGATTGVAERQGDAYLRAGKYTRALGAYRRAVARRPEDEALRRKLAFAHAQSIAVGRRSLEGEDVPEPYQGGSRMGSVETPEADLADREPSPATLQETSPGDQDQDQEQDQDQDQDEGQDDPQMAVIGQEPDPAALPPPSPDASARPMGTPVVMRPARFRLGSRREEEVPVQPYVFRGFATRVQDVRIFYESAGRLVVTGKVANTSRRPLPTPEVRVELYRGTGTLATASSGYVSRGRTILPRRQARDFRVTFRGPPRGVNSFSIEVR